MLSQQIYNLMLLPVTRQDQLLTFVLEMYTSVKICAWCSSEMSW